MTEDENPTPSDTQSSEEAAKTELRLAQTPPAPPPAPATSRPLERPPDLRVAFRGYERAATDSFLSKLEESFHKLTSERDGLKSRNAELELELEQHRTRALAVADALITAQTLAREVRAAAEREVEGNRAEAAAAKAEAITEAAELRAKAQQESAEILRNARTEADRLVEDVQKGIRDRQHEAEHILDDTKARLGSLVRDLLERLPGDASGDIAPAGGEPAPAPPD